MHPDEVVPVLDVHPPHEPMHGWRDFLLHLTTITIGLLIALGLEGLVEWQHHRHLVHEAEASLRQEIQSNESDLAGILADVHKQQGELGQDVVILQQIIANPKIPPHGLSIGFRVTGLDDVSWKTAQNTGALSYMPYAVAQDYAGIYYLQDEFDRAELEGVRATVLAAAMFANHEFTDPALIVEKNKKRIERIEVVQGQLFVLDSLVKGLDSEYKKFLKAHPE
jgi:hypothetical protein